MTTIKTCSICGDPFPSSCATRDVCSKSSCRRARKSQKSHKKEREKGWVKARSRIHDRFRGLQMAAGVAGPYRVGDHLKCSTLQFKKHIQKQFKPFPDGSMMTWDSYGFTKRDAPEGQETQGKAYGFVIDHIVPARLFDLTKKEHLDVLWCLENLRPEEHIQNLQKHDSIDLSIIPESIVQKCLEIGMDLKKIVDSNKCSA